MGVGIGRQYGCSAISQGQPEDIGIACRVTIRVTAMALAQVVGPHSSNLYPIFSN